MKHVETITLPHDLNEFTEIIDVRAPSEFAEDHLPGAINLPVLSDSQREEVGTLYNSDPFAARKLGAAMISANAAEHISTHLADKDKNYAPLVYCWRGGMRSGSLAHILRSIGWRARIIDGGYKAFRSFIRSDLTTLFSNDQLQLTILSGPTGVAKTRMLHTLREEGAQILDLEGLANHKGSVLGLTPDTEQDSQKHFETNLWHAISQLDPNKAIFTEAESNRIGKLHCPPPLWKKLGEGKVIELQLPLDQRAKFLLDDYPYFTEQTDHLKGLLERLIKLRGHDQVQKWHEQIDKRQWVDFVTSMLEDHYDLVYRQAGDGESNYSKPSSTLELADFSDQTLRKGAQRLISENP